MEEFLWQGIGCYVPGKSSSFIANTARVGTAVKGSKCLWLAVDVLQDVELSNRWPVPRGGIVRDFPRTVMLGNSDRIVLTGSYHGSPLPVSRRLASSQHNFLPYWAT